jgi:hypothetical protein
MLHGIHGLTPTIRFAFVGATDTIVHRFDGSYFGSSDEAQQSGLGSFRQVAVTQLIQSHLICQSLILDAKLRLRPAQRKLGTPS